MSKTVNSIAELNKEIQKAIDLALSTQVARVVKEQISDSVENIVYESGDPYQYERRMNHGGLSDVRVMNHTVSNGVLEVTDDASFNPYEVGEDKSFDPYGDVDLNESLAYNIEYGYGDEESWYNEARPFMEDAKKELVSSGAIKKALISGLSKSLGAGNVF